MPQLYSQWQNSHDFIKTRLKGGFLYGRNIQLLHSSSVGLTLEAQENVNSQILTDLILKAAESINSQPELLTWNYVGNLHLFNLLSQALKVTGGKIKQSSIREELFEIQFWPALNKAYLIKSEAHNVTRRNFEKIKVMIVDDSATIREILTRLITSDPQFEIVASLPNPLDVEPTLQKIRPDVITLDIHMPGLNGVELLKVIGPKYHIPTIMISSLSSEEGSYVLDALEAGAVDYIRKPEFSEIDQIKPIVLEKIRAAAQANLSRTPVKRSVKEAFHFQNLKTMIAIASSTGGVEALRVLLTALPPKIPPILIVQHIPPVFSQAFADRMNGLCPFSVKEATHMETVEANKVLIAPGGKHMRLICRNNQYFVSIDDDPPYNRHKPAADILFNSIAEINKSPCLGIILTGMGNDGAAGLLKMKNGGALTIAQDEKSCVVFGMPRSAIEMGAAEHVCALEKIPELIVKLVNGMLKAA